MWQRFTERARRIVFYAQQDAQSRQEVYVSVEHLLMGLIHDEDNTAIKIINSFGVTREAVRETLEQIIGAPQPGKASTQDMQLTPRAKRVIDLAYDEARHMNHNYIGTEHLLLGLRREGEGSAAQALAKLGLEMDPLRAAARELAPGNTGVPTKTITVPAKIARIFSAISPGKSPSLDASSEKTRWDLFTERARQTVFFAQEEAAIKGAHFVSPEHFLGALLRQGDTLAVQALTEVGLSFPEMRDVLERMMPRGETQWSGPNMPLSPDATRSLNLAFVEAQRLNQNFIGPEHLCLGLIAEGHSRAAQLLIQQGVDLERAREAVRRLHEPKEE